MHLSRQSRKSREAVHITARERILKDSESNRQIINSARRTKKMYQFLAVIIATAFISSAITLTIAADPPASAPDTVIDWEGLDAYKVNGIRYANPNDSASIYDAVNDSLTTGGMIIIPSGDYATAQITIMDANDLAIVGVGKSSHITFEGHKGIYLQNCTNIVIRDLFFEGPGSLPTSQAIVVNQDCSFIQIDTIYVTECPDDAIIITGPNTTHITVSNCVLEDTGQGLEVIGARDVLVTSCHVVNAYDGIEVNMIDGVSRAENVVLSDNFIENVEGNGIWVTGYCSNITISSNMIHDVGAVGVAIFAESTTYTPRNVSITSNKIREAGTYGIQTNAEYVTDIQILSNEIDGTTSYGMNIYSSHTLISDNIINKFASRGINIYITHNVTVIGNSIRNASSASATGVMCGGAIGSAKHIIVSGNQFSELWGTNAYGISCLAGGIQRFTLSDNTFSNFGGTSANGIFLQNADNGTISDNTCYYMGYAGIYLSACNHITISGNAISLSYRMGIFAISCWRLAINSNVITDGSRIGANVNSGIELNDCDNATVVGNLVTDTRATKLQQYGFEAHTNTDYVILIGNDLTPNLTGNYTLSGSNNIVFGNL